jgi:SAM-dependent methyltransferase
MAEQMAPPFYTRSLNAETYDLGIGRGGAGDGADIPFWRDLALGAGGRVLELGSGTGRASIPLAAAGCRVTGLDLSPAMLREAERKAAEQPAEVRSRLRFVHGDMADLALDETFDAVIIPFRSFAFLHEPGDQRRCLRAIHRHLRPGGVLGFAVFDPLLDLCTPGAGGTRRDQGIDPRTGHTIVVEVLDRFNDSLRQVLRETWRFTEVDAAGTVLRSEEEVLALRWTYRWEMHHLLELEGFTDISESSDFLGAPPAYGREQVWVARRA